MPKVRTIVYGLNTFRYGATKLWNAFPKFFRDETNFNLLASGAERDANVHAVLVIVKLCACFCIVLLNVYSSYFD